MHLFCVGGNKCFSNLITQQMKVSNTNTFTIIISPPPYHQNTKTYPYISCLPSTLLQKCKKIYRQYFIMDTVSRGRMEFKGFSPTYVFMMSENVSKAVYTNTRADYS
jgi:hypothetical protein